MERGSFSDRSVNPLQVHAERNLADRQHRFTEIDADLLGEPGWDILLMGFVAGCKGEACHIDSIAKEARISPATARRWIKALEERSLLEFKEPFIGLSRKAEDSLNRLFLKEIDACRG